MYMCIKMTWRDLFWSSLFVLGWDIHVGTCTCTEYTILVIEYSKLRSDEALESGSEDNSENGNANSGSRKLRDVGGRGRRDRGRGEDNFTQGNEEEDRDNGNNNTEEDQKDDLGQMCVSVRVTCVLCVSPTCTCVVMYTHCRHVCVLVCENCFLYLFIVLHWWCDMPGCFPAHVHLRTCMCVSSSDDGDTLVFSVKLKGRCPTWTCWRNVVLWLCS